jgi:hypothetical protein
MNDELQVAWAAGFFEGEGCITHKNKKKDRQVISLNNTDKDVIERFISIVNYGNLRGPYKSNGTKHKPTHKPYWMWEVAKKSEVKRILEMFLPYLGKRRRQRAEQALYRIT